MDSLDSIVTATCTFTPTAHCSLYIKNFILTQPMVTPVGLLAWRALPDVAWIGALIGMFVVEVFVPFGLLFCGIPRVLAGASIAGLMAGIQLTGK